MSEMGSLFVMLTIEQKINKNNVYLLLLTLRLIGMPLSAFVNRADPGSSAC